MEYLILNEESIPFNNIEDCNTYFPDFIKILSHAFYNDLSAVRVSENFDFGWYNFEIAPNYFVRDWVASMNKDRKLLLKTIIEKTMSPQIFITENEAYSESLVTEFYLKANRDICTPSLGVASILNQVSLSFCSNSYWNSPKIELLRIKLNKEGTFEDEDCIALNATKLPHWEEHFTLIETERKENVKKGHLFWISKENEFKNLHFCNSTEKSFYNLNINNATFDKLWANLKLLNNAIQHSSNEIELKENTGLNISSESESVTTNPKLNRYRYFTLPDGRKEFFGLHIKNFPASLRLHLLPDYENKKIFIGYFGKHLPTKKFQ